MGLHPTAVVGCLCALAVVSVVGCNALWAVDDLSFQPVDPSAGGAGGAGADGGGGGAGTGGKAGGGGAAPSCLSGYECRPEVTGGRYVQVTDAGACPPGQTTLPLSDCLGCACTGSSGGSCEVTLDLFPDSSCEDPGQTFVQGGIHGSCFSVQGLSGQPTVHGSALVVGTPAACAPVEGSVVPTPITACTDAPTGPCEGGVCVHESLRCVLVDAEKECPEPYHYNRLVHPETTSACTCDCTGTATCSNTNVWTYPGAGCDGGGQGVPTNESCHDTTLQGVSSTWILAGSAVTACTPSATASGASLLCCLPSTID